MAENKACGQELALCRPGGYELTRRLVEKGGFSAGDAVLDLACGSGATVAFLEDTFGIKATGTDLVPGQESAQIIRASAQALPFEDESFEGVICECSFGLFEQPEKVLREVARVLRPGGRLMLSDLYSRTVSAQLAGEANRLYTQAEVEGLLAAQGFALMLFEDHSDALKQMVGQRIMDGGAEAFYAGLGTSYAAMKKLRCGYYILLAKRA